MQFVRVGRETINLERITSIVSANNGSVFVSLGDEENAHQFRGEDAAAWKAFIEQQQTLEDALKEREEKRLREIASAAFDPFLEDQVTNLYNLFDSLMNRDELVLCLETSEAGYICLKGTYQVVVEWKFWRDAIDHIDAYRKQVGEVK